MIIHRVLNSKDVPASYKNSISSVKFADMSDDELIKENHSKHWQMRIHGPVYLVATTLYYSSSYCTPRRGIFSAENGGFQIDTYSITFFCNTIEDVVKTANFEMIHIDNMHGLPVDLRMKLKY